MWIPNKYLNGGRTKGKLKLMGARFWQIVDIMTNLGGEKNRVDTLDLDKASLASEYRFNRLNLVKFQTHWL